MQRFIARNSMASRSAYTLIEIMLTMMVLIILTSLAASPLMQSWRDQQTGSATEEVRALLAGTRILALDRDETWQFVYEPGGSHYLRVPLTAAVDESGNGTANQGKFSDTLRDGFDRLVRTSDWLAGRRRTERCCVVGSDPLLLRRDIVRSGT
jgi:Tfp pilus assembly protein FimT